MLIKRRVRELMAERTPHLLDASNRPPAPPPGPEELGGEKEVKEFKRIMWKWVKGNRGDMAKAAAAILAREYIAEPVRSDRPQALPIKGLDSMVDAMDLEGKGQKVQVPSPHVGETIQ